MPPDQITSQAGDMCDNPIAESRGHRGRKSISPVKDGIGLFEALSSNLASSRASRYHSNKPKESTKPFPEAKLASSRNGAQRHDVARKAGSLAKGRASSPRVVRDIVSWEHRAAAAAFGVDQRLEHKRQSTHHSSNTGAESQGLLVATSDCGLQHPRPAYTVNLEKFALLCGEHTGSAA